MNRTTLANTLFQREFNCPSSVPNTLQIFIIFWKWQPKNHFQVSLVSLQNPTYLINIWLKVHMYWTHSNRELVWWWCWWERECAVRPLASRIRAPASHRCVLVQTPDRTERAPISYVRYPVSYRCFQHSTCEVVADGLGYRKLSPLMDLWDFIHRIFAHYKSSVEKVSMTS